MRKVVYQCDVCHKEYPYEILGHEKDRGILFKIVWNDRGSIEVCRNCKHELMALVDKLKEKYAV